MIFTSQEYCKNGHLMSETRKFDKRGGAFCSVCRKIYDQIRWKATQAKTKEERHERYIRVDKETTKKLRHKNKEMWLSFLADLDMLHCWRCGYSNCFASIDFHHIDPTKKEVQVGLFLTQKITERRIIELKKTIPLCRNCHTELHSGMWTLDELSKILNTTEE